jgi:hypothetical protein
MTALTEDHLVGRTTELTQMITLRTNLPIHLCSVQLHDALDSSDLKQQCVISKCETKTCKTCNILNTAI